MGRIKVLFCSLCLDRNKDPANNEHSFNQSVDVSHLATPHISPNTCQTNESTEANHVTTENISNQHRSQCPTPSPLNYPSQNLGELNAQRGSPLRDSIPQLDIEFDNIQRDSPARSPSRVSINHYEVEQQQPPSAAQHELPPQQHINRINENQQRLQHVAIDLVNRPNEVSKLSYDVISVREPLAKILAERQQFLAQQQQRNNSGDHEYIEVYGERGSCFYEEIAGSVTSSVTYDQIGNNSNHNYQVLVNAYAVTNRAIGLVSDDNGASANQIYMNGSDQGSNNLTENVYDVTNPPGSPVLPKVDFGNPSKTSNYNLNSHDRDNQCSPSTSKQSPPRDKKNTVPVYSVINKPTKRGNSIFRPNLEDSRPPVPPPKNPTVNYQPSSAIRSNQDLRPIPDTPGSSSWSPVPLANKCLYNDPSNGDKEETDKASRIPQPPPRFSKNPMFNVADRPLPSPDRFDSPNNNNYNMTSRDVSQDDSESLNNGYELLKSNFDDQLDVGYEKIREPNRYSDLTNHIYSRQILPNDGYESVQPIYSSPSNALAEPNYEAIGPITASEIAAAATAKLTAAASILGQYLNKDQ